jgi:hypothetical protein
MGDGSWSRRRYLKRRLLRRSGTETIADGKGVMISTILSPLSPLSPGYFNHLPRDFRNSSSTIGFKLHCCFQRGQVEENSRLWQYMFVRSWNFKDLNAAPFVCLVCSKLSSMSAKARSSKRVQSVIMHSIFLIRH